MTVISDRFLEKIPQLHGRRIKNCMDLVTIKIQVIGRVEAILDNGIISSQQDIYVVKNLDELLLEGPAIKALKILGKIKAIYNESH